MSGIFDPALLVLFVVIGGTIWFAAAARGRSAGALAVVGAVTFFCGALIGLLGVAHTVAVIGRAVRGPAFEYNFRLYSLVMLGALQIAGGAVCFSTSWRMARGDVRAWRVAWGATALLLVVNLPLMPIQGFAVGFSVFLLVTQLVLIATRRRFTPRGDTRDGTAPEIVRVSAPSAT